MANFSRVTTAPCFGCGKRSQIVVNAEKLHRWLDGEFIQVVWPDWSPARREHLKTGTHPKCWDLMFGTED